MYKSLLSWACIPVSIKSCTGRSGTGTKQFASAVAYTCYATEDTVLVKNDQGVEKQSKTQLYVGPDVPVKVTDNVIFNGAEWPILHIATYYDAGKVSLRVLYL